MLVKGFSLPHINSHQWLITHLQMFFLIVSSPTILEIMNWREQNWYFFILYILWWCLLNSICLLILWPDSLYLVTFNRTCVNTKHPPTSECIVTRVYHLRRQYKTHHKSNTIHTQYNNSFINRLSYLEYYFITPLLYYYIIKQYTVDDIERSCNIRIYYSITRWERSLRLLFWKFPKILINNLPLFLWRHNNTTILIYVTITLSSWWVSVNSQVISLSRYVSDRTRTLYSISNINNVSYDDLLKDYHQFLLNQH